MWRHKTLQITDAMITSKGERKVNEDFCGCWQSNLKRYYVLCDGLGGHGNGDEASRFVVNSIQQAICKHKLSMNESIAFAQEQFLLIDLIFFLRIICNTSALQSILSGI